MPKVNASTAAHKTTIEHSLQAGCHSMFSWRNI
uniref:Uncharacterized protein n=1 Tax=Anguilla anguilla TaxID=7936 RepID=A0A0E9UWL1_ANGAN